MARAIAWGRCVEPSSSKAPGGSSRQVVATPTAGVMAVVSGQSGRGAVVICVGVAWTMILQTWS